MHMYGCILICMENSYRHNCKNLMEINCHTEDDLHVCTVDIIISATKYMIISLTSNESIQYKYLLSFLYELHSINQLMFNWVRMQHFRNCIFQ